MQFTDFFEPFDQQWCTVLYVIMVVSLVISALLISCSLAIALGAGGDGLPADAAQTMFLSGLQIGIAYLFQRLNYSICMAALSDTE